MITSLYQEYLYVIGKLKDTHNLTIEVNHRDVHTFFYNKKPLFKLLFGQFAKEDDESIAVSFQIDLFHPEVIQWFINIYNVHPLVRLQDSYIEDDKGDFFLGKDAIQIKNIFQAQEVLDDWLNNHTEEEIQAFVESEVHGMGDEQTKKGFDSQKQMQEAIIEFERMRKPGSDEDVN